MTDLGKSLRILRIENDENLYDMAVKLGISSSYLSSIENGLRNMPVDLLDKLKSVYCLSNEQFQKLKEEADDQQKSVFINLRNLTDEQRYMALALSRSLDKLDKGKCNDILKIIKEDKKNG